MSSARNGDTKSASQDRVAVAVSRLLLARDELGNRPCGAEQSYPAVLCRRAVFLCDQLGVPGATARTHPAAVAAALELAAEIDEYLTGSTGGAGVPTGSGDGGYPAMTSR